MYCTSPELLTQDYYDVYVTGDRPATVAPGQSFAITNARMQLIIGTKSVNVIQNFLKADQVSGTVTQFTWSATGSAPDTVDLATHGMMSFGPGQATLGNALTMDIAVPGGTIGPWTAGAAGYDPIQPNHAEIKAQLTSSTDPSIKYDLTISCDQGVPLPLTVQPVANPAAPATAPAANTVSAQSTTVRRKIKRLKMQVKGLSTTCSSSRARKIKVHVTGSRGGVREVIFWVNGHRVRRMQVSGRTLTLKLKSHKTRQRLKIRVTDESGRSVTLRKTLCVR